MKYALPARALRPTSGATSPRSAIGRVVAGSDLEARSVHLAWRDPVTGEGLVITMMATPEMIRRLESEGFSVEPEITRSAG